MNKQHVTRAGFALLAVLLGIVLWRASSGDPSPAAAGDLPEASSTSAAGIVLAGWVIDPDGQPVGGALLTADSRESGSAAAKLLQGRTSANGRFHLTGLPAGEVMVMVDADGFERERFVLGPMGPGTARIGLNLQLTKPVGGGVSDAGTTKAAPDGPPRPVLLFGRVTRRGAAAPRLRLTFGEHEPVTTGPDGSYSITLERPGPYSVSIHATRSSPAAPDASWPILLASLEVPDQDGFEWDVELPEGTLDGTVVDGDGRGVAGAWVHLRVDLGAATVDTRSLSPFPLRTTTTDAAGRYAFTDLASGRYLVLAGTQVAPSDVETVAMEVGFTSGIALSEGTPSSGVEVELHDTGRVRGRVATLSGAPVPHVGVTAHLVDQAFLIAGATTDANGDFLLIGVHPGELVLRAGQGESHGPPERAEVRAGETATVELVLHH